MALLAIIYWYGASAYLIDPGVRALSPAAAVAISIAFIAGGWLAYDGLCRLLAGNENVLAAAMLALVMVAAWALFHVFGARAAFVHVGAMIGTMMVANVFFHIIPGQKRMVADIRAGPRAGSDAGDHRQAALGAQHVLHAARAVRDDQQSLSDDLQPSVRLARARRDHARGRADPAVLRPAAQGTERWCCLPVLAVLLLVGLAVALAPAPPAPAAKSAGVTFAQLKTVLDARCVACHATQPTQAGFAQPPKGVVLETPEQIGQNAAKIAETVANRYMPIGNLTQMTDDERAVVAAWFAQGAKR